MRLTTINASAPGLVHIGLHSHSCWELVVFLQGEGIHRVGDRRIPFQPGTIVCQPPDVLHGTDSASGWQDLYLQIEGYQPPDSREVPIFQDDAEGHFTGLARFCLSAFYHADPYSAALVDGLLQSTQALLRLWSHEKNRDLLVEQFLQQMMMHLSDPNIHVPDLIRQTGYCPDAFRRRFRQATGTTPTAYLLDQRIANACKLLKTSSRGMSIRQVALQCGFEDPLYFSTMFRRRMGMNPRQYRNAVFLRSDDL